MAFTEDFASYFVDFGVIATVDGVSARGIFDNDFLTAMGITAGTGPVLLCSAADITSAEQGDSVTVNAVSYTITAKEPDGTGMTLLRLQEA
jgi:hypothetical protein